MNVIKLNNYVEVPQLGFGVFQITDKEECRKSVLTALQTGYRLIDTAACYGNERAVGQAVKESGIDRKDIFLTSKVWIQDAGYEKTKCSFEKTLENLQTDYLDLILNSQVVPAVNQVELHPFCQQKQLREMMYHYDITPMAWAPFAEGRNGIFTNETLTDIGRQYGKKPSQVILRWLRQSGIIAIPKSVHRERIEENSDIDFFRLTEEYLIRISQIDTGKGQILDIRSLLEVYRLFNIRFEQETKIIPGK